MQNDDLPWPRTIRSRQKQNRRETILDSARTLVYEFGYDAVSLDQIAERAGVTKPTLYNYFSGKDDLMLAAYLQVVESLSADLRPPSDGESPLKMFVSITQYVIDEVLGTSSGRYMWPPRQILANPEFAAAFETIRLRLADLIREGQRLGEVAEDVDPLVAVQVIVSITTNPSVARLSDRGILSKDELSRQLMAFYLRTLLPDSNR